MIEFDDSVDDRLAVVLLEERTRTRKCLVIVVPSGGKKKMS